jgi:hypothetical protein
MDSAKAQVMIIRKLLENGAKKAKYVVENADPYFKNKEDYTKFLDAIASEKDAVIYNEDGTVTLDI